MFSSADAIAVPCPAGLHRQGGPVPLRLVLARVLALRADPASAANEPQAGPPPEPQRAA